MIEFIRREFTVDAPRAAAWRHLAQVEQYLINEMKIAILPVRPDRNEISPFARYLSILLTMPPGPAYGMFGLY